MVYLVLGSMPQASDAISKFETMLKIWQLQVINRRDDNRSASIKLTVNANNPATMNLVLDIAKATFKESLLEGNMALAASAN